MKLNLDDVINIDDSSFNCSCVISARDKKGDMLKAVYYVNKHTALRQFKRTYKNQIQQYF
tara:strand:+ start:667 stop:846 length:180 start_codon:yes stop_codon:yes gene_type:complete